MNAYPLLVLVHVLGALGIFATLAMEAVWLRSLRLAETPASALVSMRLLPLPARLGPISMLVTLGSGVWLMALGWGPEAWIAAAIVAIVAMGALGGAVTGRRLRRLRGAAGREPASDLLAALRAVRNGAALSASLRLRVAMGLGVVALMVVKPAGAALSAAILGAAALGGAVAALPLAARRAPAAARRVA